MAMVLDSFVLSKKIYSCSAPALSIVFLSTFPRCQQSYSNTETRGIYHLYEKRSEQNGPRGTAEFRSLRFV